VAGFGWFLQQFASLLTLFSTNQVITKGSSYSAKKRKTNERFWGALAVKTQMGILWYKLY